MGLEGKDYHYFPATRREPSWGKPVIRIFNRNRNAVRRAYASSKRMKSDAVLRAVRDDLASMFDVERGKSDDLKLTRVMASPHAPNGVVKWDMDAISKKRPRIYLEVEAGMAVDNWHIFRDLVRICSIEDATYAIIALPKSYRGRKGPYQKAIEQFDVVFSSHRFRLPIKGLLLISY